LSSNPSIRGLQRVKHGLTRLSLAKGLTPKSVLGKDCAGIAPTKDTRYTELMLIEDAPGSLPDEIISSAVISLLEMIVTGCRLNIHPPPPCQSR